MLAKVFSAYAERDDIVILAAGISNSRELRLEEYERELNLVKKTISSIADRQLIYFGTCSVYDPDAANSPYVLHKLNVENMISDAVTNFTLFRLPQVVGRMANSKTLISFLYKSIVTHQSIDVWSGAYRYIIDVDDVASIVSHAINNKMFTNSIVNVSSNPSLVMELIKILEDITGENAICSLIEKGSFYSIDATSIRPILEQLGIEFGPKYTISVLSKYCSAGTFL